MQWYYIVGITSTVIALLYGAFKAITHLVRKNDMVVKGVPLAKKNSERITNLEKDIKENSRQIDAIWLSLEKRDKAAAKFKDEIEKGFETNRMANDLIFKALMGIANKVGADDVAEMIESSTVRMVTR